MRKCILIGDENNDSRHTGTDGEAEDRRVIKHPRLDPGRDVTTLQVRVGAPSAIVQALLAAEVWNKHKQAISSLEPWSSS